LLGRSSKLGDNTTFALFANPASFITIGVSIVNLCVIKVKGLK